MKRLKFFAGWVVRICVFAMCGAISVFLLMSGYESVYNRSLPLVHTLDSVNMSAYASSYNLDASSYSRTSLYGSFGKPTTIKLPAHSERFSIVAPLQQGGEWLARANAMHLLLPSSPRNGNIGIALLYCRASFRTLNDQNLPAVGSNVFMDTDKEWRYVFKISSAKVFSDAIPYVASDTGGNTKLIITCNDKAAHTNMVVEANLLSVQGVDQ
ncbi:MAG: hypothetical protein ACQR33_06185 [Candidatus Saccharibacteria bacterium]